MLQWSQNTNAGGLLAHIMSVTFIAALTTNNGTLENI